MRIVRPISITDGNLSSSSVAENDYAAWSAATTYGLGDYVIVTSTHRIYKSLQAGNLNKDPVTQAAWWLETTATNRWKMFDGLVGNQTSAADSVSVTLTPAERSDSVVLLNVSAASVTISVTDPIDGLVYNQTHSLVSPSGITDWYAYFFEPIVRKTELSISEMPPYSGAAIQITVIDTGNTAAIGEAIVGLSRSLGSTQYGAKVGIRDYSVKTQDAFGNYTILERAFSRRGTFSLWVDAALISELQSLFSGYRATAVAWIASDEIDATIIYGFYRDFDIDIAYPDVAICSLEIEGLT